MISKKSLSAALLVLLVIAALAVGASQLLKPQVLPAVANAPGASDMQSSGDIPKNMPAIPDSPALPAAVGQVTFSDDFNSSKLDQWHNLPEAAGTWVVQNGFLRAWGGENGDQTEDSIALVTNDTSFSDGVFEAFIYPGSGEPLGMLFRGSDAGYYRLTLGPKLPNDSPKASLARFGPGGVGGKELASTKTWPGLAYSTWQRMEVRAVGDRITVSVDNTQIFDVTDSVLKSGWVGLWNVADRGAEFDNVRVQRVAAGR